MMYNITPNLGDRCGVVGRPQTEETKAKRRQSMQAWWAQRTEAEREAISASRVGKKKPASAGQKTAERNRQRWAAMTPAEQLAFRARMSALHRGKVISAEHRAQISASGKGRPQSAEHKERIRQAKRGQAASASHRQAVSAGQRRYWASVPAEERATHPTVLALHSAAARAQSPTTIEVAVRVVLEALGIPHKTEYRIGPYRADVYIPERRLVIECDGDYWHSLPENQARDQRRDAYLQARGYTVVRLGESEIRADAGVAVARALAG